MKFGFKGWLTMLILVFTLFLVLSETAKVGPLHSNSLVNQFPISASTENQLSDPGISGYFVIWREVINFYEKRLYGYNLRTKETLLIRSGILRHPVIGGNIVAWVELQETNHIYIFDLTKREIRDLKSFSGGFLSSLTINGSGNLIVWQLNYDIQGYDLVNNTEFHIGRTNHLGYNKILVSNNYVVWEDSDGIQVYNLITKTQFQIPPTGNARAPAVAKDLVVWIEKYSIYGYNLNIGEVALVYQDTSQGRQFRRSLTASESYFLSWESDLSTGTSEMTGIYAYHIPSKKLYEIKKFVPLHIRGTGADAQRDLIAIEGNRIVWVDVSQVYMATVDIDPTFWKSRIFLPSLGKNDSGN